MKALKMKKTVVPVLASLTLLSPNAAEAAEEKKSEQVEINQSISTEIHTTDIDLENSAQVDKQDEEVKSEEIQSSESTESSNIQSNNEEVIEEETTNLENSETTIEEVNTQTEGSEKEVNNDEQTEKVTSNITLLKAEEDDILKQGSSGPKVLELKKNLAKLGFVVSNNPNEDFGPKTTKVVKEFQEYYGLPVTGEGDKATFAKIDNILSSPYNVGQSSPAVKELKLNLAKLGFVVSKNPNNDYGSKTAATVRDFQRAFGLRVNGIADEVTLNKINELLSGSLKQGMSSPRVLELKQNLAKLGFVVSKNPNNDFGPKTTTVVKEFQKYYGLPVTGEADEATLEKIDQVLSSPYQIGNRSPEIKELKLNLAKVGFKVSNNPNDYFGASTRSVVRDFQRAHGLKVNGIADEVTLAKINDLLAALEGPLKQGMSNPRVLELKQNLAKLGFVVSKNPNNDFGPKTTTVVKEFQKYYGLPVTGEADEATFEKIDQVLSSPYQIGNRSPEIKELKLNLAELGFKVSNNPNDYFGVSTRSVVRDFQRAHGLRVNGIVDEVTLAKINELIAALEGPLKQGMSNPRVLELKLNLAKLGFVVSKNPNNDFGPKTTTVVKEFQEYYGLPVTGEGDEATLTKIDEILSGPYRVGQSSPEIKELKLKLARLGFEVSANPNENYGPKTANVVKAFQSTFGLRVNGIIDEVTLEKINELFDAKYAITRIEYDLTLDEAVKMQLAAPGTPPQTDKYRNDPAYVSGKYIQVFDGGYINGSSVNLRTSTKLNTNDNIFATARNGELFVVLDDNVTGDSFNGSTKWYKVLYNNKEVYVHSSLAKLGIQVGKVKDEVNVRSKANTSGHIFGKAKKNDLLRVIEKQDNGWYQVRYGSWRNATASDIKYYLNPENFINDEVQMYQFLDLTKPSGVSESALNNYLKGKGVLEGMGNAFIQAGKLRGINELYLVAHALLETGNGTSNLAKGIEVNGVKVHNVFGIGASDEDPDKYGSQRAYEKGWTSVEKAIIGGAEFIGNDYIKKGQNTIYKMRWNPDAMVRLGKADHQYATDVGWATKQLSNLYNLYQEVGEFRLNLEIPIYKK